MKRSILVFSIVGLLGPLLVLSVGVEMELVRDTVAVLWFSWGAIPADSTKSELLPLMVSTVINVLLYAAVGGIAAMSESLWWKGIILVATLMTTWLWADWWHGSIPAFLIVSGVWIGAFVLTVVPKLNSHSK